MMVPLCNISPRIIAVGHAGHLLGDDDPIIVVAVLVGNRINVIDADGSIFPTFDRCFVKETDVVDPDRLSLAVSHSRLTAFM
jgi:hypothetical protein